MTGLRRTGLSRKKELSRRTSMRRGKRELQARVTKATTRHRDTGPVTAVKTALLDRAEGCCEICGTQLHDGTDWLRPFSRHHRRPRGAGGSRLPSTNEVTNLLLLCGSATTPDGCHHTVESNRFQALEQGWLISQGGNPATTPVVVLFGGTLTPVLLTTTGGYDEVKS